MFVVTLNCGSSPDNHKRRWLWVPARAPLGRDDRTMDPPSRMQLRTRGDDRDRRYAFNALRDDSAVSSHPARAVIDRQILALRLLLLTLLLLGAVTAIEAASGRAKHAVMAGIVTGDAADHGALQATLGLGALGRGGKRGNDEQCGNDFHDGAFL